MEHSSAIAQGEDERENEKEDTINNTVLISGLRRALKCANRE